MYLIVNKYVYRRSVTCITGIPRKHVKKIQKKLPNRHIMMYLMNSQENTNEMYTHTRHYIAILYQNKYFRRRITIHITRSQENKYWMYQENTYYMYNHTRHCISINTSKYLLLKPKRFPSMRNWYSIKVQLGRVTKNFWGWQTTCRTTCVTAFQSIHQNKHKSTSGTWLIHLIMVLRGGYSR